MNTSQIIKVSHTLDEGLIAHLDELARTEQRSRSNMIAVLLSEALAARDRLFSSLPAEARA